MKIKDLYYIKPITNSDALKIMVEYHYLHRVAPAIKSFGLFQKLDDELIGAIIYGNPTSPHAVTSLFNKNSNVSVYELNRLWIEDGTPKNTESFFISNTIKLLDREVILSFADPSVGHAGTIYQATNFLYLGLTSKNKDIKIKNLEHKSSNDANLVQYQEKYGKENVYYKDRVRKHRYIFIKANKHRKVEILNKLMFEIKPFPKKIPKYLIYGLVDPICKEVKYVGRSSDGLVRPNEHKKPCNLKKKTNKNEWIKELILNNLMYSIEILDSLENEADLNDKEIYWIDYFRRNNIVLYNETDGGEGTTGYKHTVETKLILSQKRKTYFENNIPNPESYKRKAHKIMDNIYYKHCSDCDLWKTLNDYHKYMASWDGLRSICKICALERRATITKNSPKLSPEEFQESYVKRAGRMSEGAKKAYERNPDLKKQISENNSKPIYGVNVNNKNDIIEFKSALDAKQNGFQNANVGQAIKFNKPYRGYMWYFKKTN